MTALAAYTTGPGHGQDARRQASKPGLDPNRRESLTETLTLRRLRKQHQQAERGFGRRGIAVACARHIMIYCDILKRREPDRPLAQTVPGAGDVLID